MNLFFLLLMLILLSVLVVIHEFGHFIAARLMNVEVEAFAIGWGPTIFKLKGKKTEFRLALLPLGGYCKMKGEAYLTAIYDNPESNPIPDKDSFYGISPLKRIFIALAGPFLNLLVACLGFMILSAMEVPQPLGSNKIILASDFSINETVSPAKKSGLNTGDQIIGWNGKSIKNYYDLNQAIEKNEQRSAIIKVQRFGKILELSIAPELDKTYSSKIGVYDWKNLEIEKVNSPTSPFQPGDHILEINGKPVLNQMELFKEIAPLLISEVRSLFLNFAHKDELIKTELTCRIMRGVEGKIIPLKKSEYFFPNSLQWKQTVELSESRDFLYPIHEGIWKTFFTLKKMVFSLGDLIIGKISAGEALSGPIRIVSTGERIATQGFQLSTQIGILSILNFMIILSLALFLMNMLPIPALDGGLVILNLFELIRNKPLKPKVIVRFQQIGVFIILFLLVFSTFNDLKSLLSGF